MLLNRGLLVLYTSNYKIIWTHSEVWRDNNITIEELEKEVKKESEKSIIYKYDIKTHKIKKLRSSVDHSGSITIYDIYTCSHNGVLNTLSSAKSSLLLYTILKYYTIRSQMQVAPCYKLTDINRI